MVELGRLSRASIVTGWIVAAAVWLLVIAVAVFEMPRFRHSWIGWVIPFAATSLMAGPIWVVVAVFELVARRDRKVRVGEVVILGIVAAGLVLYFVQALVGND